MNAICYHCMEWLLYRDKQHGLVSGDYQEWKRCEQMAEPWGEGLCCAACSSEYLVTYLTDDQGLGLLRGREKRDPA